MNNKGNIIITAILIFIIVLIVYFAYFNEGTGPIEKYAPEIKEIAEKTKDLNLLPKEDANIPIILKINKSEKIEINNTDINFKGIVEGKCDDENIYLENPIFKEFNGKIDLNSKTLTGKAKKIILLNNKIGLKCNLNVKYDSLEINSYYTNIEKNNVSFYIETKDLNKSFEKAYLKIKNFYGKLTSTNNLILEGKASYIKIINNSTQIEIR